MRLFNLIGSGSARAALYNACHVGSGMATSLKGQKNGWTNEDNYSPKMARPGRFCVILLFLGVEYSRNDRLENAAS